MPRANPGGGAKLLFASAQTAGPILKRRSKGIIDLRRQGDYSAGMPILRRSGPTVGSWPAKRT